MNSTGSWTCIIVLVCFWIMLERACQTHWLVLNFCA